MTLPANDPYREPDPVIDSYSYSSTGAWGIDYDIRIFMQTSPAVAAATKLSQWYMDNGGAGAKWAPDLMHVMEAAANGYTMRADTIYLLWYNGWPGWMRVHVKNPIWYRLQTPPCIALAIAHWWCGIAEADIDYTSFVNAHNHADGNSIYRTVAFHERSAIDILKELFEQSGSYLYVSGVHQLACDWFNHEPSDTPDWTIDDDNFIRVTKFGKIRDRKYPGKVRTFYDARQVSPGSPTFGIWERDAPGAAWTEKEQIMSSVYDAHFIDDVDDTGGYIDFTDYILVQVEVKGVGHLMDIGESFKFDMPSLAMSIDDDYKDNFVIHEIDMSLDGMSAIITGIKKWLWNAP